MPKDKYPNIFSLQMEAIGFIILQIFFATRAVLKIGEYLNNRVFLSRNYRLIVVPRKITIRPIVPRHKHSADVFIVHH